MLTYREVNDHPEEQLRKTCAELERRLRGGEACRAEDLLASFPDLAAHADSALEMILSGDEASPEEQARFRTEAEAAAGLQHPNIVQIYEVGSRDGRAYFSLEYLDGGSLQKKLAEAPLLARQGAELLATVAEAVH